MDKNSVPTEKKIAIIGAVAYVIYAGCVLRINYKRNQRMVLKKKLNRNTLVWMAEHVEAGPDVFLDQMWVDLEFQKIALHEM